LAVGSTAADADHGRLAAFPGILPAIAVVALLGPGIVNVILRHRDLGSAGFARLVRGTTLALKQTMYVQASARLGCRAQLMLRQSSRHDAGGDRLRFAAHGHVDLTAAALSFIGLGPSPRARVGRDAVGRPQAILGLPTTSRFFRWDGDLDYGARVQSARRRIERRLDQKLRHITGRAADRGGVSPYHGGDRQLGPLTAAPCHLFRGSYSPRAANRLGSAHLEAAFAAIRSAVPKPSVKRS